MADSSETRPQKPRQDFPLFAHRNKRWAKKVKGKLCYFGKWADDRQGERALKLWIEQKDELLAGIPQTQVTGKNAVAGTPLHKLINGWLKSKRRRLDNGQLSRTTFGEYVRTGKLVAETFGRNRAVETLTRDDFGRLNDKLAKTRGLVALGNEITRCRMVFKWGFEEGILANAVRFGSAFVKPSKADIDKQKARKGEDDEHRTFSRDEIAAIMAKVREVPELYAMLLLALNAAYGAKDLGSLRLSAIDLETAWVRFPRLKTGQKRGAKLWPETVAAIRAFLAVRPDPADPQHDDLLFINRKGKPFVRGSEGIGDDGKVNTARWANRTDLIGNRFGKVLRELGINGRRSVYGFRHTAATVADEAIPDRQAIKYLMGHAGGTITDGYVHRPPSDERMEAVADAIRSWLWPTSDAVNGGAK